MVQRGAAPRAERAPSAHSLGLPDSLIDFPADTTRAIAQLHYGNTLARTPDVKYVFSHADGTVPYLAGRFGIVDEMNVVPGAEERGSAAETFRRLYWDTAGKGTALKPGRHQPAMRIKRFDCYPSGSVILAQRGVLGHLDAALER